MKEILESMNIDSSVNNIDKDSNNYEYDLLNYIYEEKKEDIIFDKQKITKEVFGLINSFLSKKKEFNYKESVIIVKYLTMIKSKMIDGKKDIENGINYFNKIKELDITLNYEKKGFYEFFLIPFFSIINAEIDRGRVFSFISEEVLTILKYDLLKHYIYKDYNIFEIKFSGVMKSSVEENNVVEFNIKDGFVRNQDREDSIFKKEVKNFNFVDETLYKISNSNLSKEEKTKYFKSLIKVFYQQNIEIKKGVQFSLYLFNEKEKLVEEMMLVKVIETIVENSKNKLKTPIKKRFCFRMIML
ncbi:hypothetical protein JK211_14455 [Tatumella sp. JGM130]|uniref:hypothetical protein n=1 Tax=Tatumella sp. JGM130 TaxID=2799797 RepID=UPI001BAF46E1|nr:hypothetical protein [Tatumella sp. JGM130]MBS0895216.1 hypothetical protein [Tatumella sp. JGM130]